MSEAQIAAALNEEPRLPTAATTNPSGQFTIPGIINLLLGLLVKYGLPSCLCIYLLYVQAEKDKQIYQLSEKVTSALIENNHTVDKLSGKLEELSQAIRNMK